MTGHSRQLTKPFPTWSGVLNLQWFCHSILCLCCLEWHQRNKDQIILIVSYLDVREVELNLMMTEACGATKCTMMEVGGATSSMMKVHGATNSNSKNYIRLIFIFIVIREYGSTLYVGLARAISPTNTNFRLTFFTNPTSGGSL